MNRKKIVNLLTIVIAVLLLTSFVGCLSERSGVRATTLADEEISKLFASSFDHESDGETNQALNDVLNILRSDQNNYVANLRVGWLYYLEGRHDESIAFYKEASKLQPAAIEPKLGLMLPLMANKNWVESEVFGLNVLNRAPGNYLAASRLGYIYFVQAKYSKAESIYTQLLEDYPADLEMMLGLGWTYAMQGRSAEARHRFETVLAIRSNNVSARSGLDSL